MESRLSGEGGEHKKKRVLTRTEQNVLNAVLDPAHRHDRVSEIVKRAGCNERYYFEIMRDPWFREQRRLAVARYVEEQAVDFVKAAARTARKAGRDGFQDRRLLLSMSGDFIARQRQEVTVSGRVLVGVVGVSMDSI